MRQRQRLRLRRCRHHRPAKKSISLTQPFAEYPHPQKAAQTAYDASTRSALHDRPE